MKNKTKSLFIFIQFLNSVILIEVIACIIGLVFIWEKEQDVSVFSQLRIAFCSYIFVLLFMVFTSFCCFKKSPCAIVFYSVMLMITKGFLFVFIYYVIYIPTDLLIFFIRNMSNSIVFLRYIIYYQLKFKDEVTIGYYTFIGFTTFYLIMLIIYLIKLKTIKNQARKLRMNLFLPIQGYNQENDSIILVESHGVAPVPL